MNPIIMANDPIESSNMKSQSFHDCPVRLIYGLALNILFIEVTTKCYLIKPQVLVPASLLRASFGVLTAIHRR
jgi:hypothetical protein